ncbi:MAG: YjfB family protein [Zoogloeaceae bacterium]|jgi:hypothetical protein|nr:YjfB family protein [Zoogloeaceae bacterium]
MDLANIGSSSLAQTSDVVGLKVLKSAIKIQEQAAMQLLEALPAPATGNNPPNLGQSVDVWA